MPQLLVLSSPHDHGCLKIVTLMFVQLLSYRFLHFYYHCSIYLLISLHQYLRIRNL